MCFTDLDRHLGAVERSVIALNKDGAPARSVILSRVYSTPAGDLWEAMTDPERLPRWFACVDGDLKLGGRYQIEGNAGGSITECEPPTSLSLTWEFADDVSWVHVLLKEEAPGVTRLTLTHTALLSSHWNEFGPGATGIGWELGLIGLAFFVENPVADKFDERSFAQSSAGRTFLRKSAEKWGDAAIGAGDNPDTARLCAARTAAFYSGD